MGIIGNIVSNLDISLLKFKRIGQEEPKKPSLLKEVFESPERFKLEAFIEGDEIQVFVKRRESLS